MSAHICCYNENKELEHFKVPDPVFLYIIQLECEIKYGRGAIQQLYPGRFDGKFFEELK